MRLKKRRQRRAGQGCAGLSYLDFDGSGGKPAATRYRPLAAGTRPSAS
jgi:hypothetical protein